MPQRRRSKAQRAAARRAHEEGPEFPEVVSTASWGPDELGFNIAATCEQVAAALGYGGPGGMTLGACLSPALASALSGAASRVPASHPALPVIFNAATVEEEDARIRVSQNQSAAPARHLKTYALADDGARPPCFTAVDVAAIDVLRSCVRALVDLLSAVTGKAYTAEKLTHILFVLPLPHQALHTDACSAWRESRSAPNAGALIIVQPDSRLEVAAGSHRLMHRHHCLVLPEGGLNVTTEDFGVRDIFVLRQDMVHAGVAYDVRHVRFHIY